MASFLNVGDILEGSFYCALEAQRSITVLHWHVGAKTGAGVTDQEAAAVLSALAGPLFRAFMPAVADYQGMKAQKIEATVAPWVSSAAGSGVGAKAFDPLPSQSCVLVNKRTTGVIEGAFGRSFLPFWSEDNCDADGRVNAAGLALAAAWAGPMLQTNQAVVGALGTSTLEPVLYSRVHATGRTITEIKTNSAFATRKSRSQINRGDSFSPF